MDLKEYKKKTYALQKEGKELYSYSRLTTTEECWYEYYLTYIKRQQGHDNVWGISGTMVHEAHEKLYAGEVDKEYVSKKVDEFVDDMDVFGISFPNEKIAENWVKSMKHYAQNFTYIDGDNYIIEEPFLIKVDDNAYLRGFIDFQYTKDGKKYLVDWKTSSKFSGEKLHKAGRQLVLYAIAKELEGDPIDGTYWGMLKYLNFCFMQKNGKVKKKMCDRHKWVEQCKDKLLGYILESGVDEFEAEIMIDEAIENNSDEGFPAEVKEKYWIEDSFVEYEITDEVKQEAWQFVLDKIQQVRLNSSWEPKKIDQQNSFYCNFLCSHREDCEYIKQYNDGFREDDDDIFG